MMGLIGCMFNNDLMLVTESKLRWLPPKIAKSSEILILTVVDFLKSTALGWIIAPNNDKIVKQR